MLVASSPVTLPRTPYPRKVPCSLPVASQGLEHPFKFHAHKECLVCLGSLGPQGVPPSSQLTLSLQESYKGFSQRECEWRSMGKSLYGHVMGVRGAEETLKGRANVGVHYGYC